MTTAAFTLGVAHPTSYPLYVLLARAWEHLIPAGNLAYRLNLLSAAAGAGAAALLFAGLRRRGALLPAFCAAAWLALNPAFWTVAQVSEMYSLWILGAAGLLLLARELSGDAALRLWPAFAFLAGLLLGNRLDLLLWAPGLLWLAFAAPPAAAGEDALWAAACFLLFPAIAALSGSNYPFVGLVLATALLRARGAGAGRLLGPGAAAALAGLSVYLFLPLRSSTGPFLDWNHPSTLPNFLDSLLRTRYGGTLDLISRNYQTGELFLDNLRLWGAHLWDAFGPAGLAAAVAGAAAGWRADRRRWLGLAACWWWSGPVFLFIANMPPNPHAAAIIEPHYLLSDLALVVWAADGAAALAASSPLAGPALAAAALLWPLWRGVPARQDRRGEHALTDFSAGVLRAAPPGSIVVAKKDVQLYSLWHEQSVRGRRPDLRVVAQGLAGAAWYQADWRRRDPALPLSSLREPAGWAALAASGSSVHATFDADVPGVVSAAARARGPLWTLAGPPDAAEETLGEILPRRERRRHGEPPDFFTSDLIEQEAVAHYRRGVELERRGRREDAERSFLRAWARQWDFPDVPGFLGYLEATRARWPEAESYLALADALYERKLAMADEFRALPDVKAAIRRQAAESATQRGVAAEKRGRPDEAESHYRRALALAPLAQTRYNLAVLAWGKDWAAAEENLSEALRLDPNHADARRYLEQLRARRR